MPSDSKWENTRPRPRRRSGWGRSSGDFSIFLAGVTLSGTFQILTGAVHSTAALYAVRLAHTLGDAMIMVSQGILVSVLFPERRVGGNFGFMTANRTLGISLGSAGAGWLMGRYGYPAVFVFGGAVLLAAAGLSRAARRNVDIPS
ncbi:MAG: MFS transporter [Planctomycetota bacterium]